MKLGCNNYLPKNCGGPTTYTRIRLDRGSGFILDQVSKASSSGGLTRKEFCKILGRGGYGQYSILWTCLLKDNLIECANGRWVETTRDSFLAKVLCKQIASFTKDPPRYVITPKGQEILDRLHAKN